jgi:predicted PurR-regulated permease PerM
MLVVERVRGLQLLVVLAAIALALHILQLVALPFRLKQVFVVLFTSILVASAVAPAARAMERWRVPRGLTVLLMYLAAVLILGGVVALIVPLVSDELALLRERFPDYNAQLQDLVARVAPDQADRLSTTNVLNEGTDRLGGILARAPGVALTFSGVLVRIVIVLVMGYFMAVEEHFAERVMRRFTPPRYRARVARLLAMMGSQLGHWARAQLLLALSFGVAFGLGLWAMRVPYAVTLGVVGAILEVIPYVGGFTTLVLALLVASTNGWLTIGGVVVWYTVVVQAEGHIIAPKLMQRALGLHPLVVVVALFIGTESLGLFGALLAVPLAVVVQVLLDEFYAADQSDAAAKSLPAPARDARGSVVVAPNAPAAADGADRSAAPDGEQ